MGDRNHDCTTKPHFVAALAQRIDTDDPLYEAVVRVVEEIIPALTRDVDYTTKQVCGPEFWRSLETDGQKRKAGRYLAHAVSMGRLPLRFSVLHP